MGGYLGGATSWGAEIIADEDATFDPVRLAARIGPLTAIPPGEHHRETRWDPPTTVLLVPAEESHEIPALVPGIIPIMNNGTGGSSHPDLLYEDHVYVLWHWERRWRARLYYPNHANLELAVERPPRDPLVIATCAIEQWSYCCDMYQILGDVCAVARLHAPADHWAFWWD